MKLPPVTDPSMSRDNAAKIVRVLGEQNRGLVASDAASVSGVCPEAGSGPISTSCNYYEALTAHTTLQRPLSLRPTLTGPLFFVLGVTVVNLQLDNAVFRCGPEED